MAFPSDLALRPVQGASHEAVRFRPVRERLSVNVSAVVRT